MKPDDIETLKASLLKLCCINIQRVQEIIKFPNLITPAPLAPEYA